MKLYVMPGACSLASHIALGWAQSPAEIAILSHDDLTGPFALLNPKAAVPALVLEDGTVITESLAVLDYITDLYPEANLGARPGDTMGRAQMNEALAELVSDVHKAWGPFFAPMRYVTDPAQHDSARQAAFIQLDKQYRRLDGVMAGREWRVLGRRTVADAYLFVMCSWKDKTPQKLSEYPALAAYYARLEQDPAVQKARRVESTPG